MNLVLFDIDGTILRSGGAGKAALRLAVQDFFGIDDELHELEMAGCTDSGLARQIFARVSAEPTPEALREFLRIYLKRLEEVLPKLNGHLLPGIVPLLQALQARDDILLALLTGNLARGAELKLTPFGLWKFFAFGAFADDHHERNELGHFASTRAKDHHPETIPAERIYVLGDTPHDIACGRAIGARTVGVATGIHTRAQLAEHHPDYLFDDFSDVPSVLAIFDPKTAS